MKALITGATSGIGKAIAQELSRRGVSLILTGRNENALLQMQETLPVHTEIIALDLAENQAPFTLYEFCKNKHVDILVNNAGFGVFGEFTETALQEELELLQVNVRALHILTKLFLRDFKKRNFGRILNVASSAGFLTGPLFFSYYASKNYVVRLSLAIAEELRREKSRVTISILCPQGQWTPGSTTVPAYSSWVKALTPEAVAKRGSVRTADGKTAHHSGHDDACGRCRIQAGAGKAALPYPVSRPGSQTNREKIRIRFLGKAQRTVESAVCCAFSFAQKY